VGFVQIRREIGKVGGVGLERKSRSLANAISVIPAHKPLSMQLSQFGAFSHDIA